MPPDLEHYLTGTELLGCQGRVEHALTLLLDGRVRVRRGMVTFVIDPASGHVDPPSAFVPDHVVHAAGELAGRPIQRPHQHHRHSHHGGPGQGHTHRHGHGGAAHAHR